MSTSPTEPVAPVSTRWVSLYSLAMFGFFAVNWGAASILTPALASRVSAVNEVAVLGAIMALGGLVGAISAPVVGAWSDRTTSRRGRRRPWILATTLGSAGALAALSVQTGLVAVLVLGSLAAALPQCALTALSATVPDDVPVRQRATVSAWANGVAASVGLLVGTALVSVLITSVTAGYLTVAALLVVLTVPFVWLTRGSLSAAVQRPAVTWRWLLASFRFNPRRYPDFAWALGGRFCFFLANGLGTLFLYFYLQDAVHHPDPAIGLLILTAIYVVFASVAGVPAGRLSDRLGRRKTITMISASFQGLACLVLAVSQTWPAAIAGAVLLGCGFGVYAAVDQAMVTELLPEESRRAKDLGLITVAASIAGIAASVIAPLMINRFGGYQALYWLAGAVALLSAAMVQPIRRVR